MLGESGQSADAEPDDSASSANPTSTANTARQRPQVIAR
jgi:hypothetical protein